MVQNHSRCSSPDFGLLKKMRLPRTRRVATFHSGQTKITNLFQINCHLKHRNQAAANDSKPYLRIGWRLFALQKYVASELPCEHHYYQNLSFICSFINCLGSVDSPALDPTVLVIQHFDQKTVSFTLTNYRIIEINFNDFFQSVTTSLTHAPLP